MTTSKEFVLETAPGMRKALGLTQEEFGKLLGVSRTTVSRVECRDVETLTLSTISRMCDGLKRIEEKRAEISRNQAAPVLIPKKAAKTNRSDSRPLSGAI